MNRFEPAVRRRPTWHTARVVALGYVIVTATTALGQTSDPSVNQPLEQANEAISGARQLSAAGRSMDCESWLQRANALPCG